MGARPCDEVFAQAFGERKAVVIEITMDDGERVAAALRNGSG